MNTLMYCLKCRSHWWSNADDECKTCRELETQKMTDELTQEDKDLLMLLAKD